MLIVTKIGSGVNYHERTSSINSHDSLITWSCEITWWIIIIISLLPQCLWPQNLVRVVTYLERLLPIKSHDYIFKCSCEITWQTKIIIHLLSQCLYLPKLAVSFHKRVSFHKLTKSFDHVVLQRHVKYRPPNLAKWLHAMRSFSPTDHLIF